MSDKICVGCGNTLCVCNWNTDDLHDPKPEASSELLVPVKVVSKEELKKLYPEAPTTDASLPLRRMLKKAVDHYAPKPEAPRAREPLIGWMILEAQDEDMSNWEGVISYPNPTGANLAWENPTKMIEYAAYEKLEREIQRLTGCLQTANNNHERFERFWYLEQEKSAALIEALTIKTLVDKFLAWPLPETVRPDPYPPGSPFAKHNSGTNLLSADEARQLFEYLLREALAKWGKEL